MGQVFVNIGLSLDAYLAPEGMTLEHWDEPGYKTPLVTHLRYVRA